MSNTNHVAGIDWASGVWLCVEFRDCQYERVTAEATIGELWASFDSTPDRILLDAPIGLLDENDAESGAERGRRCDALARSVLGARHSSVFTPPARQAAQEARAEQPHEAASETNRELVGKGLSIQAYHIASGIAEVDDFLDPADDGVMRERRETIVESHPEVCFAAFAGGPMEYSKTSASGFGERLSALQTFHETPAATFQAICEDLAADDERDVAAIDADDVLDAMALAIAAGAEEGDLHAIPENPPEDHRGLPMQMVYRAVEPFDFGTSG